MKKLIVLMALLASGLVAETRSVIATGPFGPTNGEILARERCIKYNRELREPRLSSEEACPAVTQVFVLYVDLGFEGRFIQIVRRPMTTKPFIRDREITGLGVAPKEN